MRRKMITKEEILRDLEQFCNVKGKIVTVHASLKSIREIDDRLSAPSRGVI